MRLDSTILTSVLFRRTSWPAFKGFCKVHFSNITALSEEKPVPKVAPTADFLKKVVHLLPESVLRACIIRELVNNIVSIVPKMLAIADGWVNISSGVFYNYDFYVKFELKIEPWY